MGERIVGERWAGGVARLLLALLVLLFEAEPVVLADLGESAGSARGEETLGACLLERLLSRETGKRPLPLLATVIWWALP